MAVTDARMDKRGTYLYIKVELQQRSFYTSLTLNT